MGVVGRTGSGKSSLMCVLMRLVGVREGRVVVDGVDVSSLPLHLYRLSGWWWSGDGVVVV